MKIMAAKIPLSSYSATRLSFPLPLTKAAFNFPLYVSSDPPYQPPPIVYQEPKKKSIWPWLLPVVGVGADLAFNQGKYTYGAANWLKSLFKQKTPQERWVDPNTAGSNYENTKGLFPDYTEPSKHWETAGNTLEKATKPLAAGTLGAWATEKALPAKWLGSASKPNWFGRALKYPGRLFAGTIGVGAGIEAAQDPLSRELAKDNLMHTPVGAGVANAARWSLPSLGMAARGAFGRTWPGLAVNLGYEAVKPDFTKNLTNTALRADSNASQMDTTLNAYRAARQAGGKLNMQDAARGIRTAYGGNAGSEAPQLTWGGNLSKMWDKFMGQGSTGDIDLPNPALRALMSRMQQGK